MPRPALRRIIVFAVLGLAVLAGVLYFILKPDVWIYVDNGATEAMVVKLNGADELTVQPRRVGILKCRSGTKRITVTAGGVTVFDETKTLGGGDGSAPYKYLLNPGATGRYWEREVHYGTQFPAFRTYSTEADHYQLIASNVHLLPVAPWLAGKYWDYVLEEPPDSVKGVKGAFGDSRYVISRIQREDYDLIAGAGSKHSVTSQEMQNLEAIVDRLLKTGQ